MKEAARFGQGRQGSVSQTHTSKGSYLCQPALLWQWKSSLSMVGQASSGTWWPAAPAAAVPARGRGLKSIPGASSCMGQNRAEKAGKSLSQTHSSL